jgi:pimeloyl-ACP methyl ester carboxylesterase
MPQGTRMGLTLVASLTALYLAVVALAYLLQGRLIYPAPAASNAVPAGFEHVSYTTEDGLTLQAGYRPAVGGRATLLFFHGNGTSWHSTPYVTDYLAAQGYGVLAAEYRGYAGNPGSPSETGLYADARAAWTFLRAAEVEPQDIVLVGNSLGSGIATHLATEVEARALVLISPFDSLEETASRKLRWLPVRQLLRDRYDNAGKFPRLRLPILVLHGEEDTLIKVEQARALAAVHPGAQLVTYSRWGHDLVANRDVQRRIAKFLESLPPAE